MIGGMIGNNSCGANSVVYGSVREHLLEVKTLLSDGSEAYFAPLMNMDFWPIVMVLTLVEIYIHKYT